MARGKVYNELIHSRRWRRLRTEVLAAHPCCQRCSEEGRVKLAEEVHHIMPVESGATPQEQRRLMFNPANLRALCRQCHWTTHNEMRRRSKEKIQKRVDECVERFCSRYLKG